MNNLATDVQQAAIKTERFESDSAFPAFYSRDSLGIVSYQGTVSSHFSRSVSFHHLLHL